MKGQRSYTARRGARARKARRRRPGGTVRCGVPSAVRPAGEGGSGGRAPRAVVGGGRDGRHPRRGRLPTEAGGGAAALALAKARATEPPHWAHRHFNAGMGVGRPCAKGGGGRGAVFFRSPAPVVAAPKDQVAADMLGGNCWPEKASSVVAAVKCCRVHGCA